MKKILLCLGFFQIIGASKTVYIPRSITTDPTFDLQVFADPCVCKKDFSLMLSVQPFYISSTHSSQITRYLLPDCASNLTIRERELGNIASPWLYLLAETGEAFNSDIFMRPVFKKAGALLSAYLYFCTVGKGLWLHVNVAPMKATRTLCISEKQLGAPGTITDYTTALESLNSFGVQSFKNKVSVNGVDDIQVRLGLTLKNSRVLHLDVYGVGVFPTSNEQRGYYFAEPLLGNGKHGGVGFGLQGYATLAEDEAARWRLLFDAKYLYLLNHRAIRSFDLHNGDWSRYLLGAFEGAQTVALPLINTLTRCCRVQPRNQISLLGASEHLFGNCWVRYGLNFWWREQEKVFLHSINFDTLGIFDLAWARRGAPISASKAKIWQTAGGANAAPGDTVFIPLTADDVSKWSAVSPEAYTLKVFGGIGYVTSSRNIEVGINGFYEFSSCFAALQRWGLYGSLSFYLI